MTDVETINLPENVGRLVDAVADAFPVHRAFLTRAIENATDQELRRLSDYLSFCRTKGLDDDYLAECYLTIVCDTVDEQVYFAEHKHYRHSTFADVAESVYHDADYMNRYMYGLAISTFLWPNHVAMVRMFRASTPVESFCEVVRMVGIDFSLSWKSRRCCSPSAPSFAVTRWQ